MVRQDLSFRWPIEEQVSMIPTLEYTEFGFVEHYQVSGIAILQMTVLTGSYLY